MEARQKKGGEVVLPSFDIGQKKKIRIVRLKEDRAWRTPETGKEDEKKRVSLNRPPKRRDKKGGGKLRVISGEIGKEELQKY